jgi:hypothetical protein
MPRPSMVLRTVPFAGPTVSPFDGQAFAKMAALTSTPFGLCSSIGARLTMDASVLISGDKCIPPLEPRSTATASYVP